MVSSAEIMVKPLNFADSEPFNKFFSGEYFTLNQFYFPLLFLDSFLRMRDKADHEATAMMKAQFMSLWDGEDYVSEN